MENPEVEFSDVQRKFPRASSYDLKWVMQNQMGPNVTWLAEALSQVMRLKPGMRVLDLGCGKAVSSIFLAKEFGLQVWAADLWIKPDENWKRIQEAGLKDQVFPIYAEAHALPFADEYFDAVISLDAYHYFGTDDLYLGNYLVRHLKPTGQLGIALPGIQQEFTGALPEWLKPYWEWDFYSFHSPAWWQRHFEKTGMMALDHADLIPESWKYWWYWQELLRQNGFRYEAKEAEMLKIDAGRNLGFVRLVAHKLA
jgi:cyclopropane fatty-acyl-phospholipid synthase-like methyltransferase